MARKLDAKCSRCRREGKKLFLKGERCHTSKCAITRRGTPPGEHGQNGYPRLTGYGTQLREKQRVKKIYGVLERQFRKYFETARKNQGNTELMLYQILERRLDNVVYRLGMGVSRDQARQAITHGHFRVNGTKVNIPSYQVSVGDVISLADASTGSALFAKVGEQVTKATPVAWLAHEKGATAAKVVELPAQGDVKEYDLKLIVEFYSR